MTRETSHELSARRATIEVFVGLPQLCAIDSPLRKAGYGLVTEALHSGVPLFV